MTNNSSINPDDLTFPIEGMVTPLSSSSNNSNNNKTIEADTVTDPELKQQLKQNQEQRNQEALKDAAERQRLQKLRDKATFVHLPDDPIYKPISDELLDVNEVGRDVPVTVKIMLNAALSDYVVFRKLNDNNEVLENVKVEYKRVNYDEAQRYQDIVDELVFLNNRINILAKMTPQTLEISDKIRQTQIASKKLISEKINEGLEVFFKKNQVQDLKENKAEYDYNDILLNLEIAYFRYVKSPFLRQIS